MLTKGLSGTLAQRVLFCPALFGVCYRTGVDNPTTAPKDPNASGSCGLARPLRVTTSVAIAQKNLASIQLLGAIEGKSERRHRVEEFGLDPDVSEEVRCWRNCGDCQQRLQPLRRAVEQATQQSGLQDHEDCL